MKGGRICWLPEYEVGDPEPSGYAQWHEWAAVQSEGGLEQALCRFGRYHFPQERCRCGVLNPRL